MYQFYYYRRDKGTIKDSQKLDYNIIGSGSSGNCVRIENIMIDAGLPYTKIKNDLYKTEFLIYTHSHQDHFKAKVLQRIKAEFPNIVVASNYEVAQKANGLVDIVFNTDVPFLLGTIIITPFKAVHNVLCNGFVFSIKNLDIVYCTDTKDYSFIPDKRFDYLFLESNYDKHILKQVSKKGNKGFFQYKNSSERHASRQQCEAIYYTHRKSVDSVLIELHKSNRFYK